MKHKIWLLFILSLSTFYIYGQEKEGYIITNNNDTIKGYIAFKGTMNNCLECSFRENATDKITTYLPGDIQGYKFVPGKYYITREIDMDGTPKKVFMEWLIKGKVSILIYTHSAVNMRYFVEQSNGALHELSNTEQKKIIDNTEYIIDKKEYIGTLKNDLIDCPEMFPKIENAKLNSQSLISIVKQYHTLTCNNQECIVFEDKNRQLHVSIGATGAYYNSQINVKKSVANNFNLSRSWGYGLVFNFSNLPIIAPNFSLQTNIEYYNNTYSYQLDDNLLLHPNGDFVLYPNNYLFLNADLLRIPLSLKYSFTFNKFRPFISAGFTNYYRVAYRVLFPELTHYISSGASYKTISSYQFGLHATIGVDYEIIPHWSIGFNAGYEHGYFFFGSVNDTSSNNNVICQASIIHQFKTRPNK